MSKDSSIMKAKMWMLIGFATIVLVVMSCHTVFAQDVEIVLTPEQNKIYLSYAATLERLSEDLEDDELAKDTETKTSILLQCSAFRVYEARATHAENLALSHHRAMQAAKLLDHYVMYDLAWQIRNDQVPDPIQMTQDTSTNIIALVGQFTSMLADETTAAEINQNLSNVCNEQSAKVEGREHNL